MTPKIGFVITSMRCFALNSIKKGEFRDQTPTSMVMLLCIAVKVKAEMVVALAGDIHLARRS